ncbi:hypothetical protein L3X38_017524 [Prunus dulcis]|uniref:Uncharacterized protein n=1 Tax=Prunus dulcis TaxID=3755 RepID=A0AAD4W7F5_PRUDU|nr:hypothetical protein L3X38_017524 [Prunus dulcis]
MQCNFTTLAHAPPHAPAALGTQSDYVLPENLKTTAPNSYPRREIDGGEVRTTPAASSPFSGETAAVGGGTWLGLEEDDGPVILVQAPLSAMAR